MAYGRDFHLGPLRGLTTAGHRRVLLRLRNGFGVYRLVDRSTALVHGMLADGWELHVPLFHTEDTVIVPRAWGTPSGLHLYNLSDVFATDLAPLAADPVAALRDMVRAVTADDGVERAVYLPHVDAYPEWFHGHQEGIGAPLREAAETLLADDSGPRLVIATTFAAAGPDWAQFDRVLVVGDDEVFDERSGPDPELARARRLRAERERDERRRLFGL
ncbi:hypothetical protein [Tsukamurella soli]